MSTRTTSLIVAALLTLAGALTAGGAFAHPRGRAAAMAAPPSITATQPCSGDTFPATRDAANPLALATAPGADPLTGANFFVDGPGHGAAAGAIEQLLGLPTGPANYPDTESWSQFASTTLAAKLAADPSMAPEVHELEKIAGQEETQDVSGGAHGGGYDGIFAQVHKLICGNLQADPGSVPVFTTFLINPQGKFCADDAATKAWQPTFHTDVRAMATALGLQPAVILMEIDAVGDSHCYDTRTAALRDADLRYEIETFDSLPHTVTYIEAGAKDEDSVSYIAGLLKRICVVHRSNVCAQMRGIWVNGTHFDWSSREIAYASQISRALTRLVKRATGTHYIAHEVVNTAQNGRGPKLNPHPSTQGVEDLCNPPGRGIGRLPTGQTDPTSDGLHLPLLDAFLWTGTPGRSHSSSCHPGDAPAGVFFAKFALELATNANQQLGPGFPSRPY